MSQTADNRPRLEFANQLRGLAALLVAISHLVGVYWALRGFVALATFSPVQAGAAPALYGLISYRWFQCGPFGVALFFLISGLVIPFSLRKHSRATFLLARLLRIYPTFIVALTLEMALLDAASRHWHTPFTYGIATIVTNGLLINDLLGYPVVDFVNWTLTVEIKFYLVVALLAPAIRNGGMATLFATGIVITATDFCLAHFVHAQNNALLGTIRLESPFLIFMLIGILFNFHHSRHCGTFRLALCSLAMLGLFFCSWMFGPQRLEFPVVTMNYVTALLLFAALYACRRHIRGNFLLDGMAAISFPFYLLHAILGFTIMKYLMNGLGVGYNGALAIAVSVIVLIAILLHSTIERSTIQIGHRLAKLQLASRGIGRPR